MSNPQTLPGTRYYTKGANATYSSGVFFARCTKSKAKFHRPSGYKMATTKKPKLPLY